MTRNRKVILQDDDQTTKEFAKKLIDKGYEVMLKYPEEEEVKPYPVS